MPSILLEGWTVSPPPLPFLAWLPSAASCGDWGTLPLRWGPHDRPLWPAWCSQCGEKLSEGPLCALPALGPSHPGAC